MVVIDHLEFLSYDSKNETFLIGQGLKLYYGNHKNFPLPINYGKKIVMVKPYKLCGFLSKV